jgi:hypothetical protein
MTSLLHDFDGSCHCGALGFTFRTALPVTAWSVRACQCGFCRAHGALTSTDPAGRVAFHAREPGVLQRYRFAMKTADFLLCARCGVYLGAQIETSAGAFATINVRALTPQPAGLSSPAPAVYDGESAHERVGRREQRWTPVERMFQPRDGSRLPGEDP